MNPNQLLWRTPPATRRGAQGSVIPRTRPLVPRVSRHRSSSSRGQHAVLCVFVPPSVFPSWDLPPAAVPPAGPARSSRGTDLPRLSFRLPSGARRLRVVWEAGLWFPTAQVAKGASGLRLFQRDLLLDRRRKLLLRLL